MQSKFTQSIQKDFRPMYFDERGILFYDFTKESQISKSNLAGREIEEAIFQEARFKYKLLKIEIKDAPDHHMLHNKTFKGITLKSN